MTIEEKQKENKQKENKPKENKPKEKEFIPDYIGCNADGEEISGYSIREQPDCITVIVKFYKLSEKGNTIAKMVELLKQHNFSKKVFILDSEEFVSELKKYNVDDSLFDDFDRQTVTVELTDLISEMFVPVKMIVFK
jgi:hypothetical protein